MRMGALLGAIVGCIVALPANAWDQHSLIMQSIGRTTANLNRKYLYEKVSIPNVGEEKKTLHELATQLVLNESLIPIFSERHPGQKEIEVYELFRGEMIDEPDLGMDQNLPDSADPSGARDWMGGRTGESSRGFRHMFFGGFDYRSPLQTIQIPFRAIGEAKDRYKKMIAVSDRFFKENDRFWGVRTMLWGLHYLQDLHQPFHAVEVPAWKFLPLDSIFGGFIANSTHAIKNYHYAYEAIARTYLQQLEPTYFRGCFETDKPVVAEDLTEVIDKAKEESPLMASALYELIGPSPKSKDIDLQKNPASVDYGQLIQSSTDKNVGRLREVTCRLFQSIAQYTWGQFDRAFNYIPETSSKSGL